MWGKKTCLALCINLVPHTCWGHGQCCGCSHVSMEQVALAGKLLRDAKDSAGPGPPPPPLVVFFHLSVLACWQMLGHGEAPAVGSAHDMCYSIAVIPSLQEALG